MSALTKLFVVLLIVCSLLMTAATVVFITRTEDWRAVATTRQDRISVLQDEKQALQAQVQAALAREEKVAADSNRSVGDFQKQISDLTKKAEEANNAVAAANSKDAIAQANVAQLATAWKAAQQNLEDLQARNKAVVEDLDKLRTRNFELVGENTDYQKRLEQAERERRWLAERESQLTVEVKRFRDLLAEHRIALDAKVAPTRSVADLKGVITEVKVVDGQTYATVSLGAVDRVERGMQFNVVCQESKQFLGKLTVDKVDERQAFGRLEGPRVREVKPNHQVLSQL